MSDARLAWEDSHGALWQGDVRACLAAMEPESVQVCITSPPYWGLRSYSTEPQIWGGSPDCDHMLPEAEAPSVPRLRNGQGASTLNSTGGKLNAGWDAWQAAQAKPPMTGGSGTASAQQVSNAGSQFGNAWAEQPATNMVGNNRAIPHADGSPRWLTGGTAAFAADGHQHRGPSSATCTRCGAWRGELGSEPTPELFVEHLVDVFRAVRRVLRPDGVIFCNLGDSYQDKQLVGAPWRFALAMQAAGWWLRSEITWCKTSAMPESVTDRPTNATEKIFLFAKSERYFWDSEAVKQPFSLSSTPQRNVDRGGFPSTEQLVPGNMPHALGNGSSGLNNAGANLRNYWVLGPEPFADAHFAVFPSEIPRRAILAGSSEAGACAACGAPWARQTSKPTGGTTGASWHDHSDDQGKGNAKPTGEMVYRSYQRGETTGWAPTCSHIDADVVPCKVLDVFSGSGTSVLVARQLGRYGIGVELSEEYCAMSIKRFRQMVLL